MPTSKDYITYIQEVLRDCPDVGYRAMMGEYILYYRGVVVGGVYDNRLLLKCVKGEDAALARLSFATPYPGAKPMREVQNTEDGAYLVGLLQAVYVALSK